MAKKWDEMSFKEKFVGLGTLAGIILVVVVVITTIIGGREKSTQKQEIKEEKQVTTQVQQPQYVFDVPSLVSKNVDEVKGVLGAYQKKTVEPTEQQIKAGIKEWELEFEKDGKSLLVTYEIATKKIKDFFISTDDPSGKTKDKKHLLELGNLKEDDPRYKVEFVKALADPSYFTGVKAIPK